MCYNYSLALYRNQQEFEKIFGASFSENESLDRTYYVNSFSLPKMPVITNENPKHFQFYTWGLIPFWVKKEDDANKIRTQTMNARAETLFEKPSFRNSIKSKRCLVPADGFFEWRYILGRNYPYFIHLKHNQLFAFAGLWDRWVNPDTDETICTYSIITCEPNNLLRKIHNKKKRMPVILPNSSQHKWLKNISDKEDLMSFLVPYPDEEMEAYTISRLVTSKEKERNVQEVTKPHIYPELKGFE
jgi:putative SOS response-associated peptidase YedK